MKTTWRVRVEMNGEKSKRTCLSDSKNLLGKLPKRPLLSFKISKFEAVGS